MEPLGQDAVSFRHRGDCREHGAFRVRLVRPRGGSLARLFRGRLAGALGGPIAFSHFELHFVRCFDAGSGRLPRQDQSTTSTSTPGTARSNSSSGDGPNNRLYHGRCDRPTTTCVMPYSRTKSATVWAKSAP